MFAFEFNPVRGKNFGTFVPVGFKIFRARKNSNQLKREMLKESQIESMYENLIHESDKLPIFEIEINVPVHAHTYMNDEYPFHFEPY